MRWCRLNARTAFSHVPPAPGRRLDSYDYRVRGTGALCCLDVILIQVNSY